MADLQLWWWEDFAPSIGENRKLAQPFKLRLKAGIPKARWAKLLEFLGSAPKLSDFDDWVAEFSDLIELGPEPLIVGGKPVATLRDYFEATLSSSVGMALVTELLGAFTWHNTVDGMRAHFFERPAGRMAGTSAEGDRSTVSNPPSGSETKH